MTQHISAEIPHGVVNMGLKMTEFATTYHQKEKPGAQTWCSYKCSVFGFVMIFWNKWGSFFVTVGEVWIQNMWRFPQTEQAWKNHTLLKELTEVEKKYSPGVEIWGNKSEKNGKLEIALALNPPKKSCRSGTFYLWHADGPLLHNVCPFLLFPHNGIKSSCVILMRGFLLSGFCQLDTIPTYKKSAVTTAPSVRPLNLKSYSFQQRSWKKKLTGGGSGELFSNREPRGPPAFH